MAKWMKLTKKQYLGFFAPGLLLIALQELPYAVMPFLSLSANPLMAMQDKSPLLNAIEKALGISCIFALLFLVRGDAGRFSLHSKKEKGFFGAAILALALYYVGWIFYWNGQQSLALILGLLVAMPPIYYTLLGLWRKNSAAVVLGGLFLLVHLANVWYNFVG